MKIITPDNLDAFKRTVDGGTEEQRATVRTILSDVKKQKDQAVLSYTKQLDGADLSSLAVSEEEFQEARSQLDSEDIAILEEACANIRAFHLKQVRNSWFDTDEDGTILGQKITPLDAVGVYVPGGTAAYPSSVFMNVMPAIVAGVERIVMVSPPSEEGTLPAGVLVAAEIAGVKEIYKAGGAQAVAALAYGTESIQPVDKIVGPGNVYVALAKREVFGDVDIDMIAGPSEIVVLADDTARAEDIAADLLSQAEHDARSSSVLVTSSKTLADEVSLEVERQLATLPRKAIAEASVKDYGGIVVCDNLAQAIDAVNRLGPEHLEIQTEDPFMLLGKIKHAGAIFLGRFSSEPIGDYFAGPNHVLPTSGTARFSSPLNVDDFVKKSSVIYYSKTSYEKNADKIARFARLEGLEAHARAVETRKGSDES
ncbi:MULTISPECIES: histidinol dehydrogenase [Pontibacillus]|uniref:Histidinol dehydrogenase n=1 Tax=Pontibacillus chungwhensis TaxID=265426 RepID=A0ABY8UYF7_9BACI|nr:MULTISPECIES: histidinol dehydrogenase [Pontibacillus]MCD5325318.1 histidinol dehydrogenase [Pontibacillus sp. HN14]WIF97559.1 histidinol dehydrogenase [Pontibacillus chungwhensis]